MDRNSVEMNVRSFVAWSIEVLLIFWSLNFIGMKTFLRWDLFDLSATNIFIQNEK